MHKLQRDYSSITKAWNSFSPFWSKTVILKLNEKSCLPFTEFQLLGIGKVHIKEYKNKSYPSLKLSSIPAISKLPKTHSVEGLHERKKNYPHLLWTKKMPDHVSNFYFFWSKMQPFVSNLEKRKQKERTKGFSILSTQYGSLLVLFVL